MPLLRAGSTRVGPARFVLAAIALTAACAAAPGAAAAAPVAGQPVAGEVVVGFERGTTGSERAAARRHAGVAAERGSRLDGVQLVKVDAGESVDDAIARLERDPNVKYAQPNRWRTALASTPDDPLFGQLWGLKAIQAPQAWDVFKGVDTLVAVVDEGIEYDHPDLTANMWTNPDDPPGGGDDDGNGIVDDIHGADFAPDGPSLPDGDPRDIGGHGTHVAGTIAARGDNGLGVTGVNWRARLMAVRVLGPSGGSDLAIAEGFDYAAKEGARVVNASLGGDGSSPVMQQAMADHPETLFVVAAGNAGRNVDPPALASSPCTENNTNLICVAATTPSEGLASFSNFGATTVDIGAPGTIVLSAGLGRTRLADGFEGNDFATRWDAHVDTGTTAPWGPDSPGAASGTSIADSPTGNYAPGVASFADLATPLNLSDASGCVLHFTARIALGSGDSFFVDRSVNGWSTFSRLLTRTSSNSTGGVYRSFELPMNVDNQANVLFGFGLLSNGDGSTGDGVDIDDVAVICAQPPAGDPSFVFLDGTSMASPHVAGAATLLLGSKPSITTAELKAALLSTGDPQPALAGKTLTGRRLNLDKALRSVTPAATATPTPTPTPTATPSGGGGTTTTGGGTTQDPPTTVVQPPARLTVAQIARQARITCTRVRGKFRCRVTRTSRAVRIRLVLKRRGEVVARAAGLSGRRLKLRGAKAKPGRYKITLTVLKNDAKAVATKRIRIR